MLKYTLKRLLGALVSLFIIITTIFILLRLMPIEGYLGANWDKLSPETIAQRLHSRGLDQPVIVQLFRFYGSLLRGDLGTSWIYLEGRSITQIIMPKLEISAKVGLLSLLVSLVMGIPLGILMARKKGGWIDNLGTGFVVLVNAVPIVIYYLFIQIYLSGLLGLPILFSKSKYISWILPVLSLSLWSTASYAVWTRRYMMDQMNQNYVQLARAKGLSGKSIMTRHVFRNAFVPIIQLLPSNLLLTVVGSIYLESLYSVPGTGGLLIDVIKRQDNTMVQALVLIYSSIGIIGLFLGDILMMLIDPRIRFVKGEGER